jgi:short subunit dehydrogenase-like uncharacterized protein
MTGRQIQMAARSFDVIVFGATGFTGGLVADYLARHTTGVRWALGGRDQAKLEAVRAKLGVDVPIVLADARDGRSLRALAEQTKVVATTTGPFALHGDELVAACVERGTHYCDLSGEMQWIARMIERHHAAAQRTGARIVNACGYDSLPSDLGVFALQQHALKTLGQACTNIECLAYARGPNLSGGTFASMFNIAEEARRDKAVRRLMFDPHGLATDPKALTGSKREQLGVGHLADAGVWTAPFLMAPANVRIVHRSNSLLDYAYGRDFVYAESMPTGKGVAGAITAGVVTAGISSLLLGVGVPPLRALLKRVAPKPGTGPSEKSRQGSSFAHELYGTVGGKHLRARFAAKGDPGYGETAKMIAESALSLAFDELPSSGGLLTGASAMGDALIARLRKANFTIDAWTA